MAIPGLEGDVARLLYQEDDDWESEAQRRMDIRINRGVESRELGMRNVGAARKATEARRGRSVG